MRSRASSGASWLGNLPPSVIIAAVFHGAEDAPAYGGGGREGQEWGYCRQALGVEVCRDQPAMARCNEGNPKTYAEAPFSSEVLQKCRRGLRRLFGAKSRTTCNSFLVIGSKSRLNEPPQNKVDAIRHSMKGSLGTRFLPPVRYHPDR